MRRLLLLGLRAVLPAAGATAAQIAVARRNVTFRPDSSTARAPIRKRLRWPASRTFFGVVGCHGAGIH